MNTQIRQSRPGRRLAALALTGAAAGVMLIPGVASASQAGGPPSEPVRHVTKTRYVPREKPVLHNPRYHMPRIDIIVHNNNHSRNEHRRHDNFKHEDVKEEPIKDDKIDHTPVKEDHDHDNDKWWWPNLD